MVIKVCREEGYDYFEADSVKINIIEWGNRKLFTSDTIFILRPNIERSESVSIMIKDEKGSYSYNEPQNQLPYQLKHIEYKKGEKYFSLITDILTYLMNDEGKTIDRIN